MTAVPGRIEIPMGVRARIEDRALEALPEECCGILLGEIEGECVVVVDELHTDNSEAGDRGRGYEIAPLAVLDAHRTARGRGLEIVGFYHSHPSGHGRPSARDREKAWPAMSYLVLSVGEEGLRDFRSWRLGNEGGDLVEEEILYARPPIREDRDD